MRIAFLSPGCDAAENQAFHTLKIAAARSGCEVVPCTNSDDIEETWPDFVLVTAPLRGKLTKFPTYGVIREARTRFLENKESFHNLLSYDGYFTLSDTLSAFLTNLMFGVGRHVKICCYDHTAQQNTTSPDLLPKLSVGRAKVTYVRTRWDQRSLGLLRQLGNLCDVEIYGSTDTACDLGPISEKGRLPSDGVSVQDRYRQNGIGLVLLSPAQIADDLVPDHIFEVTSVGAVAVCGRTPWLERHFGDSIYYFDQQCPRREVIEQISGILREIATDPATAVNRARRAERIFRERFCAEKLLQNVIEYHREIGRSFGLRTKARGPRGEGPSPGETLSRVPLISVIVRCGGRPIATLRRALTSVAAQTFGHFQVILVRYKPLDVGQIVSDFSGQVNEVSVVDCFGGDRSRTLWSGLRLVRGNYFAILDDDDEWMPNHFESLFERGEEPDRAHFFAYSGYIRSYLGPKRTMEGALERRFIEGFGIAPCNNFLEQSQFFASNGFVASSAMLDDQLLVDPRIETAHDSYLILSFLAKSRARFSCRATAIHHDSEDSANLATDPRRQADLWTLCLRLASYAGQPLQIADTYNILSKYVEQAVFGNTSDPEERETIIIYRAGRSWISRAPADSLELVPVVLEAQRVWLAQDSRLTDSQSGAMSITPPSAPWAYGAQLDLGFDPEPGIAYLVEIDCHVTEGTIGFGVLNKEENDFVERVAVPASGKLARIRLPIEDTARIGRFVIQNWEAGGMAHVEVDSIRLLSA